MCVVCVLCVCCVCVLCVCVVCVCVVCVCVCVLCACQPSDDYLTEQETNNLKTRYHSLPSVLFTKAIFLIMQLK